MVPDGAAPGRRASTSRPGCPSRTSSPRWSGWPAPTARGADLICFAGAGAYDHEVPSATRSLDVPVRVRDGLHALPARGGPGRAAGPVRVPDPGGPAVPACRSPTPPSTTAPRAAVEAVNLAVGGQGPPDRLGQRRRPPALAGQVLATFARGHRPPAGRRPAPRRGRPTGRRRRDRASHRPPCWWRRPTTSGASRTSRAARAAADRHGAPCWWSASTRCPPGCCARRASDGRRRGGGGGSAVRHAAVVRRSVPRPVRLPDGARPPAARAAGRPRPSTPRAARPTSPPCGPASRTSAGRRRRRTSAPTRPSSPWRA